MDKTAWVPVQCDDELGIMFAIHDSFPAKLEISVIQRKRGEPESRGTRSQSRSRDKGRTSQSRGRKKMLIVEAAAVPCRHQEHLL